MVDLGELVRVGCSQDCAQHVLAKQHATVTQIEVGLEHCYNIHVHHRVVVVSGEQSHLSARITRRCTTKDVMICNVCPAA